MKLKPFILLTALFGCQVITRALGGAAYQKEEGDLSFPQIFARFTTAYRDAYGDPTEAMARIAVKNHANAMRNPLAQLRRPVDLEFCMTVSDKNPLIADPLGLFDCCGVSVSRGPPAFSRSALL